MERVKGPFIVELEKDGVRTFYGPFTDSKHAVEFVGYHSGAERKLIQKLVKPLPLIPHIYPDQTTISDHIDDIHDHIE